MKPVHLVFSAIAFALSGSVALAVIRGLGIGDTMLAFVVGATVGT